MPYDHLKYRTPVTGIPGTHDQHGLPDVERAWAVLEDAGDLDVLCSQEGFDDWLQLIGRQLLEAQLPVGGLQAVREGAWSGLDDLQDVQSVGQRIVKGESQRVGVHSLYDGDLDVLGLARSPGGRGVGVGDLRMGVEARRERHRNPGAPQGPFQSALEVARGGKTQSPAFGVADTQLLHGRDRGRTLWNALPGHEREGIEAIRARVVASATAPQAWLTPGAEERLTPGLDRRVASMSAMPSAEGNLAWKPLAESLHLLAPPVAAAAALVPAARVAVIDPTLADTAAFCEAYDVAPEASANCVVVSGRRGERTTFAAVMVLATDRADVNKVIRKELDVRKISFANQAEAQQLTGMMQGGITPVGLPADWPILIDEGVVSAGLVVIGGGVRDSKILLDGAALADLPGARVLPLALS